MLHQEARRCWAVPRRSCLCSSLMLWSLVEERHGNAAAASPAPRSGITWEWSSDMATLDRCQSPADERCGDAATSSAASSPRSGPTQEWSCGLLSSLAHQSPAESIPSPAMRRRRRCHYPSLEGLAWTQLPSSQLQPQ